MIRECESICCGGVFPQRNAELKLQVKGHYSNNECFVNAVTTFVHVTKKGDGGWGGWKLNYVLSLLFSLNMHINLKTFM